MPRSNRQHFINAHWFEKMSQVCYVPQLYELPPASSALTGSGFYQYQPQLQSLPHTGLPQNRCSFHLNSQFSCICMSPWRFTAEHCREAIHILDVVGLSNSLFYHPFLTPCFHTPPLAATQLRPHPEENVVNPDRVSFPL